MWRAAKVFFEPKFTDAALGMNVGADVLFCLTSSNVEVVENRSDRNRESI